MNREAYTLGEIAAKLTAKLHGNPEHQITGVAGLEEASSAEASYLAPHPYGQSIKGYEAAMQASQAGVIVMAQDREVPGDKQVLQVEDPSAAFQQLVDLFHPPIRSGFEGVHPTAVIHPSAKLGEEVSVGPHAVIDRDVVIGSGCSIGSHSYVGATVEMGSDCKLYPNVTVREGCKLGSRVTLQPGVVIGSCGFGYTTDKNGCHTQLAQRGSVVIEDDVDVGANTTIDRSRFKETIIRQGSKIDNQVMIGHSVEIGPHNLIVAQSGLAGSAKTGRYVVIGGQVGVAGHLKIGDRVQIAARSGVIGSLDEPGQYYGEPARPKAEARRYWMRILGLGKLYDKVKALELKVKELTSKLAHH